MDKFFEHWMNNIRTWRLKTCCCLAPLRTGLFIIGYCNVIISITLIVGTASDSFSPTIKHVQELVLEDDASPSVCILAPTAELAFTVLLLCGVHRNDVVLLQWYVYYGISVIVLSILIYSIVIAKISVLYIIIIAFNLCYETYIIFLVRSLIIDLKRQSDGTIAKGHTEVIIENTHIITKHENIASSDIEEKVKLAIVNEKENSDAQKEIKQINETDIENVSQSDTMAKDSVKIEDTKPAPNPVTIKRKIQKVATKSETKTVNNNKENPSKLQSGLISAKITNLSSAKRTISNINTNNSKAVQPSKIVDRPTEDMTESNDITESISTTNNIRGAKYLKSVKLNTIIPASKPTEGNSNNVEVEEAKIESTTNIKTSNVSEIDTDADKNESSGKIGENQEISKGTDGKKENIVSKKPRRFWRK